MPAYEKKKGSIIVKDSTGNLVQILPETEAGNVLYKNSDAASALQALEDADVVQGFSEIETSNITETATKTIKYRINQSQLSQSLFSVSIGLSYTNADSGETDYYIGSRSFSSSYVENGTGWSTEIDFPNETQAIFFSIVGYETLIDSEGNEEIVGTNALKKYSVEPDANYTKWSHSDDVAGTNASLASRLIEFELPVENETKTWLCNTYYSSENAEPVSIPSADRNMAFSLTGLGGFAYRLEFMWSLPDGTEEEIVPKRVKSLKTSLVRDDESVTAVSKPLSGLVQSVVGNVESRIAYERTYPKDIDYYNPDILIGDSEGTYARNS